MGVHQAQSTRLTVRQRQALSVLSTRTKFCTLETAVSDVSAACGIDPYQARDLLSGLGSRGLVREDLGHVQYVIISDLGREALGLKPRHVARPPADEELVSRQILLSKTLCAKHWCHCALPVVSEHVREALDHFNQGGFRDRLCLVAEVLAVRPEYSAPRRSIEAALMEGLRRAKAEGVKI